MEKEETIPHRQPAMRGALETGCCCWRPIVPPAIDSAPENPGAGAAPLGSPVVADDAPASPASRG